MAPPPMLLLPRRILVGGVTAAAKPRNYFRYPLLCVDRACRRSSSPSSSRRFSSNAEQSSRSRRWWSDEAQFDDEEEEGEFEFEFEEEGPSFGGSASWNQAFYEPWFTKVWRAYGYVLPLILVSILAATGPRAFLMAMAIPLAQSALSFAIRAFSNTFGRRRDDDDPGDYYYSDYRSSGWEPEDGEDSSSYSTKYRNSSTRGQQQPWAEDAKPEDSEPTADSDDTDTASSNNTSGSARGSTGFGGWDELDAGDGKYRSSSRWSAGASKAPDTAAAAAGGAASARSVGRRRRPQPETATRRRRPRNRAAARYRGQSPLFMRLLVAVFPFLGSWLRITL